MKVRIKKLPKAQNGGLSDFLSKSKDYKGAAGYGENRIALAKKMGIQNYTGTADQNTALLSMLQGSQGSSVLAPKRTVAIPTMKKAPVVAAPTAETWSRRGGKPADSTANGSANFRSKPAPADNSHLPANLLPYFQRQADANNGRVMFTDKGTKKTYYGTRDAAGKYNLNSFDVLTAKNDNPADATGKYQDIPMKQLDAEEAKGNVKNLVTPMGSFAANYSPNIYGSPGLRMGSTSVAVHKTYPGELAQRTKVLKDGNPNNNNVSWGCINGDCSDVQGLVKFAQPRDSMFIGDSRLPYDVNMKSLNENHKFGGEKYQTGGAAKAPLTSADYANWNNVVKLARTKKLDPTVLDHDPSIGYGVIDEYNKANPTSQFDRTRVQDIQQLMTDYRAKTIDKMKAITPFAQQQTGFYPTKRYGEDYSKYMPNLSKVDNFPGSLTLNWEVPSEYRTTDTGLPEGKVLDTRALDVATQMKKFGGTAQKGYAFDRGEFFHTTDDEKDNTRTLNSFLKKVPKEEANIEAEQGETVLADFDQDGELEHMKIGGEKHYNGGTPLNVPQGAFIFSDTSKMKISGPLLAEFGKTEKTKKKFTPASLAKQYDLNFFTDKTKVDGNDKFARDTAELMLDNNKQKLGKLAFVQEAMKGFPTGVPGVTQQIEAEGQEEPQMRFGGVPQFQTGGGYKPWKGDKVENKKNASIYTADEIDKMATEMGYDGPKDNLSLQTWIAAQQDSSNSMVNQKHNVYGQPHGGKLDGKWGYRWDAALNGVRKTAPNLARPPFPGIQPFQYPNGSVPAPSPEVPGFTGPVPGNPNFKNGVPRNVGPNAWDVIDTLHAATRPIDHIRPQMFRADAQISDPTFVDNRAEIQQIQSVGRGNNEVVQNTSSGQVARANTLGLAGKLFDPINQSDGQMNNTNIGVENNWKANRDAVMNNKTIINLDALSKFVGQNDMYRANLSKEKQLKFNDTVLQGQNMTNNMANMDAILARTPNMTVRGPFWTPGFKPGLPGENILGSPQGNSGAGMGYNDLKKQYQELYGPAEPTQEQLFRFHQSLLSRTKTTTKGLSNIPDETQVTNYQ